MPVIVFRGLLASQESESVIREIEALRLIGDQSRTFRCHRQDDTFDSGLLGHHELDIPQGPLTVAALGWDPPERSTHFHVSVLSVNGNEVSLNAQAPSPEELSVIENTLSRLNTKSMTLLKGQGIDHALVWERRVDLLTRDPKEASELGLKHALPEGDLENELRRLIDDSINVLSEEEFNLRRIDQGVKPLNLAWPWGHGERRTVSNMALRLGYPWRVYSSSLAMRGYARLSGFRPEKIARLDSLQATSLANLVRAVQSEPRSLVDIDFSDLQGEEHMEEKAYKTDEIGRQFVMPLMDWFSDHKEPLFFLATNPDDDGVLAVIEEKPSGRNHFPFDERVLPERSIPQISLAKVLELASSAFGAG